jgi:uracil phosphoribosyltransferase
MISELYEKPILIVGIMRSGTTMLNRVLNAHPQLYFFYNQTDFLKILS